MDQKPTLSDLLAHRDGELVDADLAAQLAADPEAVDQLDRLERIRGELRSLPPVSPDPAVWQAIQERTGRTRPGWLQRFPLAVAASVFLAAAATIMLWDPMTGQLEGAGGPQVAVSDPVAELMLRSQRLESQLFTQASATANATSSEQALLYGIADVDAQLSELYEAGRRNPDERERLWRQRVMLLESLADVQRGQAVVRPAIY